MEHPLANTPIDKQYLNYLVKTFVRFAQSFKFVPIQGWFPLGNEFMDVAEADNLGFRPDDVFVEV